MTILVIVGVLFLLGGAALALDIGGLGSRTTAGADRLEDDRARSGASRADVPRNLGRQIGWGLVAAGVVILVVGLIA